MLADYQTRAVATAIYPRQYAIAYPALGLIGELNELKQAWLDWEDGFTELDLSLIKEMGDVMWYCANLAADLGVSLSTLDSLAPATMPSDKAVGIFAEKLKKLIRDESDDKREYVLAFITSVIASIRKLCDDFCFSFEDVLTTNLDKLESRKERGTLQGDGDNR